MKNMKRFLSVAMAVLMMFALVISASAKTVYEFDDTKDVAANSDNRSYLASNKYFEDALQMMVDLEIITGRATSGELNLDASAPVTRLEFVTMLYKFMNGGSVPNSSFATLNPFTDIPWGPEYAGWAHSSGIAAGIGDNKFGSSNSIKMVDAVTFLIKALGVKPEYENFTGDNYTTQAMIIGNYLGLIPGDFSVANQNALTRAEVACLFNFALESPMQEYNVSYNGTTAVYTRKDVVLNNATQAAITKFFGYSRYEGLIVGNYYFGLGESNTTSTTGKTRLEARAKDGVDLTTYTYLTMSFDVGLEKIGYGFYLYAKLDNSGNISKYSGFNYTGTESINNTGSLYTDGTYISTGTNSAYDKDKKISKYAIDVTASKVNIYNNYEPYTVADLGSVGVLGGTTWNSTDEVVDPTGYCNVFQHNRLRAVVTDYGANYFVEDVTAAKITSTANSKYTIAQADDLDSVSVSKKSIATSYFLTDETIVSGDYVLYAPIGSSGYYTLRKATVLEGSATAFSGGSLRIDGTLYARYAVNGAPLYYEENNSANATLVSLGTDHKFYVLNGKIVSYVQTGSSTSDTGANYCYISEIWRVGGSTATWEVKAYSSADPSGKVYVVNSSTTNYSKLSASDSATYNPVGKIFKYSISGSQIVLGSSQSSDFSLSTTTGGIDAYSATVNMTGDVNSSNTFSVRINSGSVFFLITASGDITVASGRPASFLAQTALTQGDFFISSSTYAYSSSTNIHTGTVNAALLTGFVPKDLSDLYVWGTAAATVNSDHSGTFTAFNGSSTVTYSFSDTTRWRGVSGNQIPYNFDPTDSLVRIQRDSSGDITNITMVASASTPSQATQPGATTAYGAGAFVSGAKGAYLVNSIAFDTNAGEVKVVDSGKKNAYWDDYPDGMKVYLVDYTGDTTSYRNITSSLASENLEDDSYEYTYYAIFNSDDEPTTIWIIMEIPD